MTSLTPTTPKEIASRKVTLGEQAEVMGSHAGGWWDDCDTADKSKNLKYLFEVVEYDEKHSFVVGCGQEATENKLWLLLSE